jgi:hypothetical protein
MSGDANRDRSGRFARGNRAGPGRPVGARSKLSERFLSDLFKEWRRSGAKALARLAESDPATLAKIVSHLLPKQLDQSLNLNVSVLAQIQEIEDFNAAYVFALKHVGAQIEADAEPEMLEASNGHGAE